MGSSPPAPNPSGDYLVLRLIFLNLVCVALFPLRWSLFSIGVEASTFEFEGRDTYTLPFDHLSFLGSFFTCFRDSLSPENEHYVGGLFPRAITGSGSPG